MPRMCHVAVDLYTVPVLRDFIDLRLIDAGHAVRVTALALRMTTARMQQSIASLLQQ